MGTTIKDTRIITGGTKGDKKKIPAGASIEKKEVSINVEEIENGFLITKNTEVRYKLKDKEYTDYAYITEKYFSKTNPLTIKMNNTSLAEDFD